MATVDAAQPSKLWITGAERPIKASPESGFHPPLLRGITHRTIGGSHTESRGFTHQTV